LFHKVPVDSALGQALGLGARMMKKTGRAVEPDFRLAKPNWRCPGTGLCR